MQKLVFVNGAGKEINLTSGNFGITNWEGLANTDLNIQTQQVPFEDGGVFLDALLEQREISVTVAIQDNNDLELRYQKKRELISALNPKLGEGVLTYTNDYLSRQIKAVPQIPIFENKNSNDAGTLKASVVFSCPSPYWEDVEEKNVLVNIGQVLNIKNEGDIKTQVKIELFGDAKNPIIKNTNTNQLIKYNGNLDGALLINTNNGEKSVYSESFNFNNNIAFKNKLNSVVYSLNINSFIAVGNSGIIIKSEDGIDWQIIYSQLPDNINLSKIIYEKGIFITVGSSNTILVSVDGVDWTKITNYGGVTDNYNDITYSPDLDLFIIAGNSSLIKSTNGYDWTVADNIGLKSVIYLNDQQKFMGSYESDYILTSTDGINWESASTSLPHFSVKGLLYSQEKSIYVLYGSSSSHIYKYRSTDGINWESMTRPYAITDIIYVSELDLFVATDVGDIYTSKDCIEWNIVSIWDLRGTSFNSIIYNKYYNKYIIVCGSGVIVTSNDLTNFDIIKNTVVPSDLRCMAYSTKSDYFLVCGLNQGLAKSIDGYNWETVDAHIEGYALFQDVLDLFYSEKLNMFIGSGGTGIIVSTDGINWTSVYLISYYRMWKTIYAENLNLFVSVGEHGTITTSTDGINWTTRESGTTVDLSSIAYNSEENIFVAIQYTPNALIVTSTDGINWTVRDISEEYLTMTDVTYSKEHNLFVIVCGDGLKLVSRNGIDWTQLERKSNALYSVIYNSYYNLFVAVGPNVEISYDGFNWIKYSGVFPCKLYNVYFSDKLKNFYIMGNNANMYISNIIKGENKIQNITSESDMNFNLQQGNNNILLVKEEGNISCRISYRQKYIGV